MKRVCGTAFPKDWGKGQAYKWRYNKGVSKAGEMDFRTSVTVPRKLRRSGKRPFHWLGDK